MEVLILLGSPRPSGNSATLARRFGETAEKMGATVKAYHLNKLSYRGCQACMTCKGKLDHCVLKDDLTEVLDAVRTADILVMATPVYYGEVSSQMKGFIDRTFSYLAPDYRTNPAPSRLPAGKKLVFIQTQAQPDEKLFNDIFPRYRMFFSWYGFNDIHLIRGCGVIDKDDAQSRPELMQLAEETTMRLLSSRKL